MREHRQFVEGGFSRLMNSVKSKPKPILAQWLFPSIKDVFFLAFFLTPFLGSGSKALGDSDTGWHIRNGEQILRTMSLPRTDYFSYTAYGDPWFAWEWLADVFMAVVHKYAGMNGIVLWASTTFSLTFTLLFIFTFRQGGNVLFCVLLSGLAGFAASIHWLARPHLFTMLLLPLTVMILQKFEATGNRRWLWFLPPMFLVWTNLHGGFVAGVIVITIYALGHGLTSLTSKDEAARAGALQPAKEYAKIAAICLAVTLLNPYGVHLYTHIYHSYVGSDFLLNRISEFRSPDFHIDVVKYFEFLILIVLVMAAATYRRLSFVEIGLVVFWTHMALVSARHIPLYVLMMTPILARHWTGYVEALSTDDRLRPWVRRLVDPVKRYCANLGAMETQFKGVVYPVVIVGLVLVISLNRGQLFGHTVLDKGFDKKVFPVNAANFIEQQKIEGKLFSTDQWSGYLIYRFFPRYPVFFDGRSDMYGEDLMNEYLKLAYLEHDWRKVIEKYQFDWMVLPFNIPLPSLMKELPGWRVVYDDHYAIVFVKEGKLNSRVQPKLCQHAAVGPKPASCLLNDTEDSDHQ
jgi:hypothetical protein